MTAFTFTEESTRSEATITSMIIANNFFIIQVPLDEKIIRQAKRRRMGLSVVV
jgi:hypothetical protein